MLILLAIFAPLVHLAPLEKPSGIDDEVSSKIQTFHPDCADPHNKEVACTVHRAVCSQPLLPFTKPGLEPPEPHDFRFESFSKAKTRGKQSHDLHVDVSWQMPPKNESTYLKAFRLEIVKIGGDTICFDFNVSKFNLNQDSASPRFHFTSDTLFDFSATYVATLYSLPKSKEKAPHVTTSKTMPSNMENGPNDQDNITEYCKTHSHPEASKWTAGFRKIFLQSASRTIQLEFVGAPPQFCFEEYEVRLLDETGIELLFHTIIDVKDMKKEFIEGKWVSFGEYNFTGLDLDVDYIPSVIPVDTAADGRCLCPTSEQHGACSCIAADWKKVRLHKVDKPDVNKSSSNATKAAPKEKGNESIYTLKNVFYGFLIVIGAIVLVAATFILVWCLCRRFKPQSKDNTAVLFKKESFGLLNGELKPLIINCKLSVLVIYAHDGPLHETAVIAFAELLRDVYGFEVHLDVWDMEEIETNLTEYINAAIVRSERVIIINSMGAYHRFQAKHGKAGPVERISASPLDRLFSTQIDLALQHPRVLSIRFPYTASTDLIYSLSPLLQYTMPDNLNLMIETMIDKPLKNDCRLSGYSPHLAKLNKAISRMVDYIIHEPGWFDLLHERRPLLQPSAPLELTVPASPQRSGAVIVPTTPMSEEEAPLIFEESEEEASPMVNGESIPDEPVESGFFSETIQTTQEEEQEEEVAVPQVTDKPRIQILDPKDPRHAEENQDSGMFSDLVSGQLIA